MDTPNLNRLQAAILQAERGIADVLEEQKRLLLDLASAPTESAVHAELGRLDGVLGTARARMNHLMAARDEAAAADATGNRAERRAQRAATRKRIDMLSAQATKQYQAIIEHAEKFAPLLAGFARTHEDLAALARAYVTPAEQHLPLSRQHVRASVIDMTDRTPASAFLQGALFDAGLGRTSGLQFDTPFVPFSGNVTLTEHLTGLSRYLDQADRTLNERDRVLGDALEPDVASEPPVQELVALERGYHKGRLVEPGQTVGIACETPPAWTAPVGTPLPPKVGNGARHDTKPIAAQTAVANKRAHYASAMQGNAPIDRPKEG